MQNNNNADAYATNLATQLRKGFLAYCVLKVCSDAPLYTSDIIARLSDAKLVIVEGTIYPLLTRLHKDGLLTYEWVESEQGPPRKYYSVTTFGREVMELTGRDIRALGKIIEKV